MMKDTNAMKDTRTKNDTIRNAESTITRDRDDERARPLQDVESGWLSYQPETEENEGGGTVEERKRMSMAQICSHGDHPEKDPYRSHVMPLYQTSTFGFETAEAGAKFFAHEAGGASHSYSRLGNPTVERAEQVIADLETFGMEERGEGMLFGSGMAAIVTGMMGLAMGKRILAQEALYGCTSQFLQEQAEGLGIRVTHVDVSDLAQVEEALTRYDDIALIYLESIANPTMRLADVEAIVALARGAQHPIRVMVDNTFATPYHVRPLELGADLVVHSTTKYLNGHGTVVGGALAARDGFFASSGMAVWRKNLGGISGPFDAWLTLLGLKTFPLRMRKHSENGMRVARFLEGHPAVERVYYPGLESHPDVTLAERMMENGFGGMMAFELRGGLEAGETLMNRVKVPTLAVSLGTVDSLIQHPASMTHSVVLPEVRKHAGITDGLVRLSVGIEEAEDLIEDLREALEPVGGF
jgi:methionine-gamma-lyase